MIMHTPECTLNTDIWERTKARYTYDYPGYCRTCSGWGGKWEQYDPSPAGTEPSRGLMTRFTLCPNCMEIGMCPRCGRLAWDMDDKADVEEVCPFCGYKLEDMEGIPEEPECTCDM